MSRSRLVLLGLDGLPLDLARSLAPELPNLARLAERAGTVEAEIPELSPVNWTSLYTAQGPETHSVYGFTKLDPKTYQLSVVSSLDVACPSIFDRLGEAGLVSRVVNLPNTWPAKPLRGKWWSRARPEKARRSPSLRMSRRRCWPGVAKATRWSGFCASRFVWCMAGISQAIRASGTES